MKRTSHATALGASVVLVIAALLTAAPAAALETVSTFAADCTTPKTVFQLGDTVCAKVDSVAPADLNNIFLQWVAPSGVIAGSPGTTLVTSSPQTFTQALPTSGAGAERGLWEAQTANLSNSAARVAANFRVPRMGVIGVRRDSNVTSYVLNTNTTGFADGQVTFGQAGDIGLWGDWLGTGRYTAGVYRPSGGTFHIALSNSVPTADIVFEITGVVGGAPVVGDWTGDGTTKVGVYVDGTVYLRNTLTTGAADTTFNYGIPGDQIVAGDFDGDGISTMAVYRDGVFFVRNSNTTGIADLAFAYGMSGDNPVVGNWTAADGISKPGILRPSEATYYLRNTLNTGNADNVVTFGVVGDVPDLTAHNEAAVVSAGGTLNYTQGQAATAIDAAVSVTDMDTTTLVGATAQITTNCASGEDVLSVAAQNGISGVYTAPTCLLTLSGQSLVANYQTALQSVTYNNSAGSPSTLSRTVTWQVNDGAAANNLGNLATSTVNVAAKQSQTITFTSSAPGAAAVGGPTYTVTATGGGSGNPVTFTIDATATTVCSIAGSTVSFIGVGTCVIDANQAGNATYDAALQVQQSFAVGKGSQTITFTSSAPGAATVGGPTYTVTATGGASGNPVTFTIDASATTVCSIAGSTVFFTAVGTCVIDANQAGDANYNAAPQAQQSFAVGKGSQAISFTSTAPSDAKVGGPTYTVAATGGASGNPVTFTIDAVASSICSIVGATVSFGPNPGTCVIDANQAGNANYNAAPQAQQSFLVHQAPSFTSAATATFAPGKTGQTFSVTTTGSPTNTITRTGTLPSGVTFTDNGNNTATIAGTPAAGTQTSSPYSWIITASNGTPPDAVQNPFTFNVTCPTINVSGTIPALTYNVAMSTVTFTQANGNGTITWSQTGLPTGVGINSGNGQVTGTPSVTGTFNVTITATDAGGCTGSKNQSVTVAPVATGDSYTGLVDNTQLVITGGSTGSPATPFVGKTTLLTANDQPSGNVSATAGTFATSAGGSVTIAADGTFVYTPKANPTAGRTTSDSFTYTVTSNTGGGAAVTSAAAAVNLTLVGRVWYVLNNGGGGNGQSQSPFNLLSDTIAASTAGASATDTDTIYVYQGDGTTTNLATASILKSLQSFIGQGVALVVNGNTLVGAGGFPLVGNTLTLANTVTVNGIDMSTAGNSGLVGTSTTNLNVTVRNLTTSTGTALDLSGATHPSGTVTVSTVTTNGSGSGAVHVSLTNVDATVALNGGSLAGAGANTKAIDINGGTGAFTYAGTISNTGSTGTNGGGISVASKTGGAVTFSGTTMTLNTGGNTAVNLSSNTGVTVTFSPAGGGNGLDITTTSGNGFNATGGGTVNVTGSGNTINSGTGAALNVTTTIGASGLNFQSISANGGTNGIVLNGTGSSGGLTVAGNGGTCTSLASTCTGGTIQGPTGHGISLNSTQSPSFNFMKIENIGLSGIFGTNVTNFTLSNSVIDGVNTSHTANDSNVAFNTSGGSSTENNLSGAVAITNNTINNSYQDGISIKNYAGTISSLTITGNSLTSSTSAASSFGSAVAITANRNSAGANFSTITAGSISGNTINNFPNGAGILMIAGTSAAGGTHGGGNIASLASPFVINSNTINGGASEMGTNGIQVTVGNFADAFWSIGANGAANNISNVKGNGIACSKFGNNSGSGTNASKCIIAFNVITANNIANSAGINTGADNGTVNTDTPKLYLDIHNNTVSNTTGNGILSTIRNADGNGVFSIVNNTVNQPIQGTTAYGIRVDAGNGGESVGATVCLKISGNTSTGGKNGSGTIQAPGIGLRQNNQSGPAGTFNIDGLTPNPSDDAQMEAYVGNIGQNPGSVNGTFGADGVASIDSGATFHAATCTIP